MVVLSVARALGANLIECPDCEKPVSKRAVACPHCGCPGEFIVEIVRRQEEDKRPKSVVHVKADSGGGYGVAIEEDGMRYVFLPIQAVGSAKTLALQTVQGAELPYSHLEVASEASLIRFRVNSESLAYLRRSTTPSDGLSTFLDKHGIPQAAQVAKANPVARIAAPVIRIGDDQRAVAIHVQNDSGGQWVALTQTLAWTAVEPTRLREQAALLSNLTHRKPSDQVSHADRHALANSEWLCREFLERAQAILKALPPPPTKSP